MVERSRRRVQLPGLAVPRLLLRLARGRPLSYRWGYDRGQPIDRYYIDRFLGEHRADIAGRVLEVKTGEYARRFGSDISELDVLDIDTQNPEATIVADLTVADAVADDSFDCFVLTQTLHYVYDLGAAMQHARRILRPGGVLLATVPSVSRISTEAAPELRDYWRFTEASCRELVRRDFGDRDPVVRTFGNVLSCCAFLAGLAAEDLSDRRLDQHDERFPLVVGIRAVKA
jgi:SAM-dependent methyltransferase